MPESTEIETLDGPPVRLDVDVCRAMGAHVNLRAADAADDGDAADGEDTSPGTMFGHFSRFNNWYEINSWWEGRFIERLAPGAFTKTLRERKDAGETPIRVLLEHGFDPQVGDKPLGVPSVLEERDGGPYAEVPLFDTSYNRDLAPALAAGAYGQSFRFRVLIDEWIEPDADGYEATGNPAWDNLPQRTIKEVRVIEFGPTVFPANPAADAGLRSTTDEFYERLLRRDPSGHAQALARTQTLRTPTKPATETPAPATSPEPVEERAADATPDEPRKHSEVPDNTDQTRSTTTMADETMTVEERSARQSEIRARLAEIDDQFASAEMSAEAETEWNSLSAEFDDHERAIEASNQRRERLAALDPERNGESPARTTVGRTAPNVTPRKAENIYDLAAIRQQARSVDDVARLTTDYARRAIEQARFPGAKDRARSQAAVERLLDTVDDENATLARRILATGSPTYDRAFGKAVKALRTEGLTAEEQRALSMGTDSAGGFAVPFDLDPTIMLTSDGVIDPLRSISRVEQIVGKEWQGITSAGVTVSRSDEGTEVGDNPPSMDDEVVRTTRVTGFVPFSMELELSWSAMRSSITTLLADAKATEEAGSFINGTGVAPEAEGLLGAAGIAATSDVTANAFAVGTLYDLEEALPPRFRARAKWLANRAVYNAARQLDTAGGANLWVRLPDSLGSELIGYPVAEASEMVAAAAGTIGDRYLVFGDFSQFLIVDRIGMNVELVPHLLGANRRPTGQRGILAVWMNNCHVLIDNAFRVAKKAA